MSEPTQIPSAHQAGEAPHGTRRGYLTGFVLSVILTVIPFALVMGELVPAGWAIGVAIACALVQIVVHMIYFLHMNGNSEGGWTMMALIFTAIIVAIALAGSLWVMHNMNSNMMPDMDGMSMSGTM